MEWHNINNRHPEPGQLVMIYDGNIYEIATYLGINQNFDHNGIHGKRLYNHTSSCIDEKYHFECPRVFWAMQTCECCNDVDNVTHWSYFDRIIK